MPSSVAVRLQVEKIVASRVFAASDRMIRFLRFIVDQGTTDPSALKEIVIGVRVFDRDGSYDPALDPIVRVEARRLRAKLSSYYATEGKTDDLIIEVPKGTYVPAFRQRNEDAPAAARCASIAVLPLVDLGLASESTGGDYFSDGLTEEIIHALTKLEGLRVVAWHTAAQLKGHEEDIAGVRDRLHVQYVLRGRVRRDAVRLRVTVQLIDTGNGQYLWSEAYDRHLRDAFAVQEEIARSIAQTLQLTLAKPESRSDTKTPDARAYHLYLSGRAHWNRRTEEELQRSIVCFEKAVLLEPTFASAWAGIADAYNLLGDLGFRSPDNMVRKAVIAAQRALELDSQSAEAYSSLALVRSQYDWEWADGERLFRRAIELNPGYATARHWYAVDHLAMLGRLEEAHREIEFAHELDPLSSIIGDSRALVHLLKRDYDGAIRHIERVIERDSTFHRARASLGRAYLQAGDYRSAIELLNEARELMGDIPSVLGALGQAYALCGRRDEARELLERLCADGNTRHVPWTPFAVIYIGLGDVPRALEYLSRAVELRQRSVTSLKVHPLYDAIRSEPDFQALLRQVRLD